MKAIEGFESVEAMGGNEYRQLPPGGYTAYITKAEDVPDKEYLKLEFEICDGEYKGYGADCLERNGFTPLRFIRSYKPKAAGFFKQFINTMEQGNHGYKWNWDEKTLVNRYLGVVMGEEEYRKRDGSIGTRLTVTRLLTPNEVVYGKFKVPAKKTLAVEDAPTSFAPLPSDSDLPFDL